MGECAAHRGIAHGLVAPLFEQGRVCATHLAQFGIGRYTDSQVSTKLKVTGIDLFSAGNFGGGATELGFEEIMLSDPTAGVYKKLGIQGDKLVGACLYGETVDGSWYFKLLRDGRSVADIRDKLMFGQSHIGNIGANLGSPGPEDHYVFNKLAKGVLGTNNIDTYSRLCMSSAVAGYKAALGADAPPARYDDIPHAQLLFIAGSNLAWAHPVLYRRVEDARRANPALKLMVDDPRRTETAEQADLHLQLQPGTDVALFHGLLHVMLWEGLTDVRHIAEHTRGFDALKAVVREFTPRETARVTGLNGDDIVLAARWFDRTLDAHTGAQAGAKALARAATLSLYCQGLNQSSSGTAKNAALINLHLATGQIGKPGAGPFWLTGQPNAMGGREVGGLAKLLSAHRDLANPEHRAEVARLWGIPAVPAKLGKTAVEMF